MKRYKIKPSSTVILGFLTRQDQYDAVFGDGDILESDGRTVWVVSNGRRDESITTPNIIDYLLKDDKIEEL